MNRKKFSILVIALIALTLVPHLAITSARYKGYLTFGCYAMAGMLIPLTISGMVIVFEKKAKELTVFSLILTLVFNIVATAITITIDRQLLALISLSFALIVCTALMIMNFMISDGGGADSEEDAEGGATLAEIPEIPFLEYGDKKLNFVALTARENTSVAGMIAGPITGCKGNIAKRIGRIKERVTIWGKGHPDIIFKDNVLESAKVVGLNYPTSKGSNGTIYSSYIDVVIPGFGINRIIVDVAKIPHPTDVQNGKAGPLTSVPIVTGWLKDGTDARDENYNAPVCPAGYHPHTKGTAKIQMLNYTIKLSECGLNGKLLDPVTYLRADPYMFDSIKDSSPLSQEEGINTAELYDMGAIMNTLVASMGKKK